MSAIKNFLPYYLLFREIVVHSNLSSQKPPLGPTYKHIGIRRCTAIRTFLRNRMEIVLFCGIHLKKERKDIFLVMKLQKKGLQYQTEREQNCLLRECMPQHIETRYVIGSLSHLRHAGNRELVLNLSLNQLLMKSCAPTKKSFHI